MVHWQRTLPWRSSFLITVPTGGSRDADSSAAPSGASDAAIAGLAVSDSARFVFFVEVFLDVVFFFDMVWSLFVRWAHRGPGEIVTRSDRPESLVMVLMLVGMS